jgi:protein-tyrosine phosphatase/Fe-S-cluster containining protein
MSKYPLTWITRNLAVGHAPMSYDELDSIKSQGIDAIVNLCGEYSDLHEIEESSGFEVFFLPIPDENAPAMPEMEEGLEWLDEAVYLGKKVLVHCKHGIGRTGTFVTAYLLRRGFSLKQAGKMLKETRANPTNFSQWWLLRKFGKKEGQLTLQEPTSENRKHDNLEPFFTRYEQLIDAIDSSVSKTVACSEACHNCDGQSSLELIEALYLHAKVNVSLSNEKRKELINRAAQKEFTDTGEKDITPLTMHNEAPACPLYQGAACLLHRFRPVSCRLHGQAMPVEERTAIQQELKLLSSEVFTAVFGTPCDQSLPPVAIADVVSGRFIQNYFHYLAAYKNNGIK